jgi:hypothetical protein
MPTGYTADVASGKIDTLDAFALMCARGMGACVMMRDASHDAPIPERFEPSSYHAERIAEARAEIERLSGLSTAELAELAATNRAEVIARNAIYVAEREAQRARYKAMIAKVSAWTGAPEGIQEFMLSQLQESLQFDCSGEVYQAAVPSADGAEWRADEIAKAERTIAYHTPEQAKEVERTESRNAWLAQLRKSLR